jgi:hypothetical protein
MVVFQFLEVGVGLRMLNPEKRTFCIVNVSKKSQHDSDRGGDCVPPLCGFHLRYVLQLQVIDIQFDRRLKERWKLIALKEHVL